MSGFKQLFLATIIASTAVGALAIPAKPGLSQRTMPDGTQLTVRLVGDESVHYWLSEDNYLIMPDESGYFCYATTNAGRCIKSAQRVSNIGNRSDVELNFISTIDKAVTMQALQQQQSAIIKSKLAKQAKLKSTYPTTGEQLGIVILVEYSDVKFTIENPHEKFDNMLNAPGFSDDGATGSARDWFIDNSCGQFTPHFDVYGPVTLSKPRSYYGNNDTNGDDEFAYVMVTEACAYLDDEVDFTQYDRDNDGEVDNVYIFYAGYGENLGGDAPANSVWPQSDDIVNLTSQIFTHDGVRLNHFACSNEIRLDNSLDGIGVFCHEFSHVLGLPDLYSTNYSNAFTPCEWSVLDEGPYNNNGHTPPYYTAFERYSLGWLTPKEIGKPARLSLDEISTNQAFIITTASDNEYFIIENRQQNGWDAYIPGHGMLVWHIDYNEAVWNTNTVNNKKSHQYVDIEEADNIQSSGTYDGDPFPGSYNITSFTDDTAPSMCSWDGSRQNKPITNITEKNGLISFTISDNQDELMAVEALEASDVEQTAFTANWTANDEATDYLLSVYTTTTLPSGKISYEYVNGFERYNVGNVTSFKVTSLTPSTEYKYSVKSYDNINEKESLASNEVSVTTLAPSFEYTTPQAIEACDISTNGFTANWVAMPEATGYKLNVYQKEYGTPNVETVDFTGGLQELPQGWDTNSNLTYSQASYSGESAPALRLASSESYIATATYPDGIRAVEFWHRGINAADNASIEIGVKTNGEWSCLQSMSINNSPGGETTHIDSNQLPNGCLAVSLTYKTDSRGSLAIDDIKVEHGGLIATHPINGYDALAVGNVDNYAVTVAIAGDDTYFYTVQALQDDKASLTSNEIAVKLPSSVADITTDNQIKITTIGRKIIATTSAPAAATLYNLTGTAVATAKASNGAVELQAPTTGIYLLNIANHTSKIIIR